MPKSKVKKSAKKKTAPKTKTAPKAKTAQKKKAKRYSSKERSSLLVKYAQLRKAGDTAQEASKKVGVPYITLRSWEKKSGKGKKATTRSIRSELKKAVSPSAKQSRAAALAKSSGLTLVTPTGYRIEGITSADLIKVLKAL